MYSRAYVSIGHHWWNHANDTSTHNHYFVRTYRHTHSYASHMYVMCTCTCEYLSQWWELGGTCSQAESSRLERSHVRRHKTPHECHTEPTFPSQHSWPHFPRHQHHASCIVYLLSQKFSNLSNILAGGNEMWTSSVTSIVAVTSVACKHCRELLQTN